MFPLIQLRFSLSTCTRGLSASDGWTSLENKLSTLSYQEQCPSQGISLFPSECSSSLNARKSGRLDKKDSALLTSHYGGQTKNLSINENVRKFNLWRGTDGLKSTFLKSCHECHLDQTRSFSTTSATWENKSYYDVLNVSSQASGREIKSAYLKMSKEYHPDVNVNNPDAMAKFQAVAEAYETLSNPSLRSKYDTGVLGRSSSVADREKTSHRFENESFYGSRSKRESMEGSSSDLDSWVTRQRGRDFEKNQTYKYEKKHGIGHTVLYKEVGQLHRSNRKVDNSIKSVLFIPFMIIVLIYFLKGLFESKIVEDMSDF